MRLVRGVVAATVGAIVLAGCSDAETANETLPSTTQSPAETSAGLTPLGPPDLPMPDEARQDSAEAAAAFMQYYLAIVNRSSTDMDSRYLRDFAQACETCDRLADETDTDARAGYHYIGGQLVLDGEVEAAVTSPGTAEAAFLIDQRPLQVVDQQGAPVPNLSFPALDNLSSGAAAAWRPELQSWVMTDLTLG